MKQNETVILVVLAIVVVGFFMFRQTVVPATTSKINLVPAGSQAAFANPFGAYGTMGGPIGSNGPILNPWAGQAAIAQANAQAKIAQAGYNAQTTQTLYKGIGGVLGNAIDTFGSSSDNTDSTDSNA